MNLYKKMASDTLLFGISSFTSKFLIFILIPLYTRVLTTEEYGVVDLLINLINMTYPLLTLSIAEAVLRFTLEKDKDPNKVLSVSLFLLFFAGIILILFTPVIHCFSESLSIYWIPFIALFIGYGLQNIFAFYCKGKGLTRLFAVQGIIHTICTIILNVILLLFFKFGMAGYLIATISAYYFAVLYMILAGKLLPDIKNFKIDKLIMKTMLIYSIPMIPSMIAWWINSSADKYMIIAFIGMGASGIYAVSCKIPSIINTVSDIFNQAFFLSSVNNYKENGNDLFYKNISHYFVLLCVVCCYLLIGCSELIGKLLFANEYYMGWTLIPYLLLASVFSSMSAFLASIFRTLMKTNVLFFSTGIGALVNIFLNFIFIKKYGIIGAAYGTLIGFIVVWIMRQCVLKKYMNVNMLTLKNCLLFFILLIEAFIMNKNLAFKYYYVVCLGAILFGLCLRDFTVIKTKVKMLIAHILQKKG